MTKEVIYCPVCNHNSQYNFSSRDLMFNHYERFDYNKCIHCELIFQHPLPSEDKISSFYPNEYDIYEEHSRLKKISGIKLAILKNQFGYNHLKVKLTDFFLAKCIQFFRKNQFEVPYTPNGTLLDIGCGNGRFLHGMKQLGWLTKGVEFNAHAVAVCNKSGLDVCHGDLFTANFNEASFDIINLCHVIEHVPKPKLLFEEISRILKPGGLLIVKTPNSKALGRALFNTNWFANEVPRHLYLFSERNLLMMGEECQLELITINTSSTPKIILNSIDYVLNNNKKPSKKIWWRRLLVKPYIFLAKYKNQGDEIHAILKKI